MEQYTIYCTEEQTKNALELGAPIHRIPIGGRDESKPSYFTKQPDEEGWAECHAYYIPTAEQMIGFILESGRGYSIDLSELIREQGYKQGCLTFIDSCLKR